MTVELDADRSVPERPEADRSEFWRRTHRAWDGAFYVGFAIALFSVVIAGGHRAYPAAGLIVGIAVAYTVIGRPAVRTGDGRRSLVYLVLLVILTSVAVYLQAFGTLLLFVAYTQIWYLGTSRRQSIWLCVALTVGVFGALAVGPETEDPFSMLSQGAVALAFAIALGLWVTQVAEQSERNADLLADLEAAQGQLARSHHDAGVAAERERMAREIHDTLAQGFTSVVMLTQTALTDLDRDRPGAARERMALVEAVARDNLAEARALVAAFSPVGLAGGDLVDALGRLADRFTAESRVAVTLAVDPEAGRGLDREQEVVLLRAAQEALTNVRRHAAATSVRLSLRVDAGAHLEITDDGAGLAPGKQEGYGLRGMRRRVEESGGTLSVEPGPGSGTVVRVSLPGGGGGTKA